MDSVHLPHPAQIKQAPCDLLWHWLSRVALNSYIYLAQCGLHTACGYERTRRLTQSGPAHPQKTVSCPEPSAIANRASSRSAAVLVSLLVIKLSNVMPFSLIKGLSKGREGTLFWLEFHKAQVVQPAARSLVLVGCTPALGLFIVLSLVVKEEEWQEGTVGP